VAREVAKHARAVLLADMRSRREKYRALGKSMDETVDVEAIEAYFADL
jgi:hypothetical protein